MNLFGGMAAQAGSKFLDSMASQHGSTVGARILRPFQDFETPWGKGPYWSQKTIPETTEASARASLRGTVSEARAQGLHPLFALGRGGGSGFSPGPVRAGMAGPQHGGGSGVPRGLHAAQVEAARAAASADLARANYFNSLAAKERQATGGDPGAGFGGPGVKVTKLPEGAPVTRRPLGRPLRDRPLVENPNVSSPLRQELVGDDGYVYRTLTDEAGDEIKQADLVFQMITRMSRKARLALPRELQVQWGRWKRRRDNNRRRNAVMHNRGR